MNASSAFRVHELRDRYIAVQYLDDLATSHEIEVAGQMVPQL